MRIAGKIVYFVHPRLFDAFVDEVDQSHPTYDFVQGWHDWKGPTGESLPVNFLKQMNLGFF